MRALHSVIWRGLVFIMLLAVSVAQQPRPKSEAAKPPQQGPKSGTAGSDQKKAQQTPDEKKIQATSGQDDREPNNIDLSQYVGTEACKDCHESAGGSFAANLHSKTLTNKRPDRQGCEACHGAGKPHAESGDPDNIIRFESLSKAGTTKICSQCHLFSKEQGSPLHMQHGKADVGCLECHSVHSAKVQERLLKSEKSKLCSVCHLNRQP